MMYMTDFHTSRHIIQKIWISIAPFKELKRIGLAFTITDVGTEAGIPIMQLGNWISLEQMQ